jgi:hypothetical protein
MTMSTRTIDTKEFAEKLREDASKASLAGEHWTAGRLLGAAVVIETLAARVNELAPPGPAPEPAKE